MYLENMCGYPQFSFWILIALAKMCSFHIVRLCVFILVGNLLKNPNISGQTRDVQNICTVTKPGLLTGYVGGTAQFSQTCTIMHNFQNHAKSHKILKDLLLNILKYLMKSGISFITDIPRNNREIPRFP